MITGSPDGMFTAGVPFPYSYLGFANPFMAARDRPDLRI